MLILITYLLLQFIEDRLDMLNSGTGFSDEFEFEVNTYEVNSSNNLRSQYKEWVTTMKVCNNFLFFCAIFKFNIITYMLMILFIYFI